MRQPPLETEAPWRFTYTGPCGDRKAAAYGNADRGRRDGRQEPQFRGQRWQAGFTLTELTVAVPGVKSMLTATLSDAEALSEAECSQMVMQTIRLQVVDVRVNKSFVSFRSKRA